MIVAGIILLVIAYLVDVPSPIDTLILVLGWILLIVGVLFFVLGLIGRPVGGRRFWF